MALFDDLGMRKTKKSAIFDFCEINTDELNTTGGTYIIDGGFLIHRVVWPKESTYKTISDTYVNYVHRHFGSNVVIVFDGYDDNTNNIKAMEQRRRSSKLPTSHEIRFDGTMSPTMSQEKFLSNVHNKSRFISMLSEKFQENNIFVKQAQDDADVLIIETALEQSTNPVIVVGEDVDLLVILIARADCNREIFFLKPGKGSVESKMFSSKSFDGHKKSKNHILFWHAITGCDTTSAIFSKGKKRALKILEDREDLQRCAESFTQKNSSHEEITDSGIKYILALYGAQPSESSIDQHRYFSFVKSTNNNRAVKLESLPPTWSAAQQHVYRVYFQVQKWLGNNDLTPETWGWAMKNNVLQPVTTLLPPAPDVLLNRIFCNCMKRCGPRCGCRIMGIPCSTACGYCHGQSCLNSESPENLEAETADDYIYPDHENMPPLDFLYQSPIEDTQETEETDDDAVHQDDEMSDLAALELLQDTEEEDV